MTAPSVQTARRVLREEANALVQMAESLGEPFAQAVDVLHQVTGRIVCTGVGKSGHVARKIAATFASTGAPALFVHATEASHGDLGMIGQKDAVLALSRSGETRELADVIAYSHRFGVPLLGMTARPDSALARQSTVVLLIPDAPEAAAGVDAPTTSTTLQIALGDALAVALIERRGFTAGDFRTFHPGGKLGAMLRTVGDLMHADLPLVRADTPMREGLLVMSEKRFGALGVVDEAGRLTGLVTDGDLRRHMDDALLGQSAGQIMTASPRTVASTTLAADALKLMNDNSITVLFVVDDGKPVGILHVHDLLRAGVI